MDNIFQMITMFNLIAAIVYAYRYHRHIRPALHAINETHSVMPLIAADVTTLYAVGGLDNLRLTAIEDHIKFTTPITPEMYSMTKQHITETFID